MAEDLDIDPSEKMSSNVAGVSDETMQTVGPEGFQAIDFQNSYQQVSQMIEYVNDTRADFAGTVLVPEAWYPLFLDEAHLTLTKIRDLEVDHVEDTVEWTDEANVTHEVLVRSQDELGFDDVITHYVSVLKRFEEYFNAHTTLLRSGYLQKKQK